jgi:hypothetical protein
MILSPRIPNYDDSGRGGGGGGGGGYRGDGGDTGFDDYGGGYV